MDNTERAPGREAPAAPAEPEAAEVESESARLPANEKRPELESLGLDPDESRRWADEYIATGRHDADGFLAWVHERLGR